MKITDIYSQFMIPSNLQEHMQQVAAVSSIFLDNTTEINLDRTSIIQACLLHDVAKPMHFDLDKQAAFGMTETEIEKLALIQEEIKTKFGIVEHDAVVAICQKLGCTQNAVRIVDNLEWEFVSKLLVEKDTESLLTIYSDMRIGPKGILPIEERITEVKKRENVGDYSNFLRFGEELEQYLLEKCLIDLRSVSRELIEEQLDVLRNTDI